MIPLAADAGGADPEAGLAFMAEDKPRFVTVPGLAEPGPSGTDTASVLRARRRLDALWQRGRDFTGSQTAIVGGAMSWVSERRLVSAISEAGGFGVLACGSMTPAHLEAEIEGTKALTSRPFGVNLITSHPRLLELIDACARHGVGQIVLANGIPSVAEIRRVKDAGAKLLCFASALPIARKLVRMGVDAIIIEGMEAGGHIGPVSTSVLAQEILPYITEVPVFVAGGIGHGEAIVSYLEMGASGVQLGTRFVCAHESIAHPRLKQAFIRANARDAVPSVQIDPRFPVIPVRAIANGTTRRFIEFQRERLDRVERGEISRASAQRQIESFWIGTLRSAVIDGDVENGSLMAGQSVGMVTCEQSTKEIIGQLVEEAVQGLVARERMRCG